MDDFAQSTLKSQLNDYHLLVAEVLTGMDAELTSLRNRLDTIAGPPARVASSAGALNMETRLQALEERQRIVEIEVVHLKSRLDAIQTGTQHMLRSLEQRLSGHAR